MEHVGHVCYLFLVSKKKSISLPKYVKEIAKKRVLNLKKQKQGLLPSKALLRPQFHYHLLYEIYKSRLMRCDISKLQYCFFMTLRCFTFAFQQVKGAVDSTYFQVNHHIYMSCRFYFRETHFTHIYR